MLKLIERTGRLIGSVLITFLTFSLSQIITYTIYMVTNEAIPLSGRIASIASPLIITPFLSWGFLTLLLRINSLEKEMRVLATYDTLTGVYNRNSFFPACSSMLNLLKREKSVLTILYIDVDHFKKINDTYGHDVGDFVLSNIGKYMIADIRNSDIVGRIGGEEFIVALPRTGIEDGIVIAEKLRKGISQLDMVFDKAIVLNTSVSIGISCNSHNNDLGIDELLKMADSALYHAKKNGRNNLHVNQECLDKKSYKKILGLIKQFGNKRKNPLTDLSWNHRTGP